MRLATLQRNGLITVSFSDMSASFYIEPLFWQRLTHIQKLGLGVLTRKYVYGQETKNGKNYSFIFLFDMTSHDKLATVFLDDGHIDIFK